MTNLKIILTPAKSQEEHMAMVAAINNTIDSLPSNYKKDGAMMAKNLLDEIETLTGYAAKEDAPKLYAVYNIGDLVRSDVELAEVIRRLADYHFDILSAKENQSLFGPNGIIEEKLRSVTSIAEDNVGELHTALSRIHKRICADHQAVKSNSAFWVRPSELEDFNSVDFDECARVLKEVHDVTADNADECYPKIFTLLTSNNWLRFYLNELLPLAGMYNAAN